MKSKRTPPLDLETIMPLMLGIWRRFEKISGPADRLQTREFRSVVECIERFKDVKKLFEQNPNYFDDRNLLGAYFLYNFVVNYQEGMSLIGEIPDTPRRVLDICSGPGAFSFAALRHGAHEVIATDKNENALRLASEICGRYGMPLTTRIWDCLKKPLPVDGEFDLIILGYALDELFPSNQKGFNKEQQNFIQMLLNKLTPDGYLLLVENSYPESNRRLLELRDKLVKDNVPVQAPCVWKGECPALKTTNSPCYAQRTFEKPYLIREIQRAANINLSSLKMSYVIFKSPKASWPALPEGNFYRVISPPIEVQKTKRFYLCGTDGKKTLDCRLTEIPKEAKAFEYLKRGELISIEDANEKLNAFDISEETKLKVIAACGKPLI